MKEKKKEHRTNDSFDSLILLTNRT